MVWRLVILRFCDFGFGPALRLSLATLRCVWVVGLGFSWFLGFGLVWYGFLVGLSVLGRLLVCWLSAGYFGFVVGLVWVPVFLGFAAWGFGFGFLDFL